MQDERQQRQREEIRVECARLGITITPRGNAWKLQGLGVDIVVTDLALLTATDLVPCQLWKRPGR